MAHHGISAAARTRNAVVAFAVAASGMTAIASTAQALAPVGGDAQLVVADVSGGTSQDLSATSLLTVNINGTHSLAKPVALPTANAGSDKAFTLSGTSNGNGTLSRTVDGNYLAIAGYNQAPGPTGVVGVPDPKDTTSAQIGRMVARIATDGTVNTSTLLGTTVFNKSAPRGVASVNGSSFYVSGNGGTAPDSPVSGVDKVDLGGGNLARINQTAQKNVRQVQIADGGLYATSDKAPLLGFGKFNGASLPTTATAVTQLAAITTVSSAPKPVSDSYVPDALLVLDADPAESASTPRTAPPGRSTGPRPGTIRSSPDGSTPAAPPSSSMQQRAAPRATPWSRSTIPRPPHRRPSAQRPPSRRPPTATRSAASPSRPPAGTPARSRAMPPPPPWPTPPSAARSATHTTRTRS